MSYVRCGKDSDLYMFASGDALECIVAYEVAKRLDVPPCRTFWWRDGELEARQEALAHIQYLIKSGVRVPDRPIERLLREIQEIRDDRSERRGDEG